jgi:hypothetical protein
MNILYIEDDELDQKNMEWICSYFSDVKFVIVDDFDDVSEVIAKQSFDLVFSDRNVEMSQFSEYVHLWETIPYYVLSNTVFEEEVTPQPLKYLQKPLTKTVFEEIINGDKEILDIPNLSYFEQIPTEELKIMMKDLLLKELIKAKEDIPIYINTDTKQLIRTIHNLASKFSILGMENTFHLSKKIETELRNDKAVGGLIDDLLKRINLALEYLTTKI